MIGKSGERFGAAAARGRVAVAVCTALLTISMAVQGQVKSDKADIVFKNGKIVTVSGPSTIVRAVAIRDGRFIAVGSDAAMSTHIGANTRVVDLRGQTVLPGLYDNHVHVEVGREAQERIDLTRIENLADLQDALRKYAAKRPAGEWIVGNVPHGTGGVEPFTEENLPTRWDLDKATPDHPVALNRGHLMLTNSLALKKAGIDRNTPQPPGGRIDHAANGEPNGTLRETPARRAITSVIPDPPVMSDEKALAAIRTKLREEMAFGKTSINVPGVMVGTNMLRWLQDLYAREGESLPRLTVQVRLSPGYDTYDDPKEGIMKSLDELEGLQVHTGFGNDRLKFGAIKMSIDGAFSGQAAWLHDSYPGRPDYHGTQRIPQFTFYPVAKRAHELGWQLGIHAIGDGAVDMVIDNMDRILKESPRADHRHYIYHMEVRPTPSRMDIMAKQNIIAAMQPNFAYTVAPFLKRALSAEKMEHNNPQQSLADHGIRMSYGTDGLPGNPWVGFYAAVTRKGIDGVVYGTDERVPIADVVKYYTLGSAYQTFDEKNRGSVEVGKYADLVVVDRDVMTVDPEQLKDVKAVMTVVGGEILYQQPPGAPIP